MWGTRRLQEQVSAGWLCYWIAGGIAVLVVYHAKYRAREWSVIGRWIMDAVYGWTGWVD